MTAASCCSASAVRAANSCSTLPRGGVALGLVAHVVGLGAGLLEDASRLRVNLALPVQGVLLGLLADLLRVRLGVGDDRLGVGAGTGDQVTGLVVGQRQNLRHPLTELGEGRGAVLVLLLGGDDGRLRGVRARLQLLHMPLQLLGLLLQRGQRGGQLTDVLVHLGRLVATQNGAERGWAFTAHVF